MQRQRACQCPRRAQPPSLAPHLQVTVLLRWVDQPDTLSEGSCHSVQSAEPERRHYHHAGTCGYELAGAPACRPMVLPPCAVRATLAGLAAAWTACSTGMPTRLV